MGKNYVPGKTSSLVLSLQHYSNITRVDMSIINCRENLGFVYDIVVANDFSLTNVSVGSLIAPANFCLVT